MIPTPAIPEPFAVALWVVGGFVVLVGTIFAVMRSGRKELIDAIDERFKHAIQSEPFRAVVDERVSAALTGFAEADKLWRRGAEEATRSQAGEIARAKAAARAAHRRLDKINAPGSWIEDEEWVAKEPVR